MVDCSIILVLWNEKEYIIPCIESIYQMTKDITYEIIVSDNGSTDGGVELVRERFPEVIVIENGENLGFGGANNRGLDIAKGKYIFYLNNDTKLLTNSIKKLIDYWESQKTNSLGVLGTYLVDSEGKDAGAYSEFPSYSNLIIQMTIHMFYDFFWAVSKRLELTKMRKWLTQKRKKISGNKLERNVREVDYVCGADMFMLNNEMARFDTRYRAYFEETDLQLQIKKKGLKRIIIPDADIIHYTNENRKKTSWQESIRTIFEYQISCVKYAQKNLGTDAKLLKYIVELNWKNPYIRRNEKTVEYRREIAELKKN